MISNITQLSSKILLVLGLGLLVLGCSPTNKYKPKEIAQKSQLEWRMLQSKEFTTKNELVLHRAVITALQDEGFTIQNYDKDIGLISAYVEYNQVDEASKEWRTGNLQNGWQTIKKIESSTTVTLIGKNQYRVRINLVQKGIADTGGVLWSQPVDNPKTYQTIFSKVDKSLFLQSENL